MILNNLNKQIYTGERPSPVLYFKPIRYMAALLYFAVVINLFAAPPVFAQSDSHTEGVKTVFAAISAGLATGNVSSFSKFITNQTYLSLSSSVNGYFSPNQAFYILQDFLKNGSPISFKFTMMETEGNPYATGVIYFETRNRKSTAQVYISLTKSGTNWYISQLTIK